MWDKRKHRSLDEYLAMNQNVVCEMMWEDRRAVVDGVAYQPLWWWNREIRVFWEPDIDETTVQLVCREIDDFSRELGIGSFDFQLFGSHESAMEQIHASMYRGELDEQRLMASAVSEHWRDESRGGRQHGDIFITRQSFKDDRVSWGCASFVYGTMALMLHGDRQRNHRFLRGLVRHEATHLLGMSFHCDDFQNVGDFHYDGSCNMHYSIPSDQLCPKCTAWIRNTWELLQHIQERHREAC